ncbi:MAG: histidine triad nucleotide-binding protein [Chloroflexota bacterium]
MEESVFTKIIKRQIPAEIHYEDDDLIVIQDINPQTPVHMLIIPKKQIPTINDATEEDRDLLGKMVLIGKQVAKDKGISETGYKLVFNVGEEAGQTVWHIHCHVLGGREFSAEDKEKANSQKKEVQL